MGWYPLEWLPCHVQAQKNAGNYACVTHLLHVNVLSAQQPDARLQESVSWLPRLLPTSEVRYVRRARHQCSKAGALTAHISAVHSPLLRRAARTINSHLTHIAVHHQALHFSCGIPPQPVCLASEVYLVITLPKATLRAHKASGCSLLVAALIKGVMVAPLTGNGPLLHRHASGRADWRPWRPLRSEACRVHGLHVAACRPAVSALRMRS